MPNFDKIEKDLNYNKSTYKIEKDLQFANNFTKSISLHQHPTNQPIITSTNNSDHRIQI